MSRVKIHDHETYSFHNFSCSHIELTSEIFSGLLGGGCHGLLESLTVMLLHIRKKYLWQSKCWETKFI